MMKFGLLIFILLFSSTGKCDDFIDAVREYYKQYRDYTRRPRFDHDRSGVPITYNPQGEYQVYRLSLQREPGPGLAAVPVCAGCPSVFHLTREVNQIVRHMAAADPDNQQDNLLEEVGELEAMYYVAESADPSGEGTDCERRRLPGNLIGEDWFFDEGEAEIMFRREVDISSLGALQLSNGEKRTYIYREKPPNQDRVIRIDVDENGQARVAYYRLNVTPETIRRRSRSHHNTYTLGEVTSYNSRIDEHNYFQAQYGFGVRMRNGLPEDLLLADVRGTTELTNSLRLTGSLMLTAREYYGRLGLTDDEDNELVYLSLDRSGYIRTTVPFRIGAGPSNHTKGEASVSVKDASASLSATVDGVNLGTLMTRFEYDGRQFSVGHQVEIEDAVLISIRFDHRPYEDTEDRENIVWLRLEGRWGL